MSTMGSQCGVHYIGNASDCPPRNTSSNFQLHAHTHGAQTFEIVLELYVISLMCVIGLFGNVMCVVVLRRDKQRRQTSFLLQALAIADGLYITFALMRYSLKHLIDKTEWVRMQPYVFPLLKTCQTLTIWMMVLVTLDRFLHVCHPLKTPHIFRKRRGVAVFIVTVAAIVYNLPRFFDSCVMTWHDRCSNTTTSRMVYAANFNNTLYFDLYQYFMYILFLYVLPLATLLVLNIRLIQAIRVSTRRIQGGQSSESSSYETNATLVLVIIILIFIICETPELLLKIATVVSRNLESTGIFNTGLIRFGIINEVLMVINSSSNFVIYVLFGKRFRHIMKETFKSLAQSNATTFTPESPAHHVIPPFQFARH